MKITIAIILFLSVINVKAANESKYILKEYKNKNEKTLMIDVNLDGKVDRIEKYVKGELKEVEIDRDFRGKINEWITYQDYENDTTPIEIIKKDTNFDQEPDKTETVFKNLNHKLLITVTEVDKDFDGDMDDRYVTHTDLYQKSEIVKCQETNQFDKLNIFSLTRDIDKIKDGLNVDFYETLGGYRIHKSCMNNWGAKDFVDILKNGMNAGVMCLKKLAAENIKNNTQPNGAYNNLKNLDYLLNTKKVSIVCHEEKCDWEGTVAHASTGPKDKIDALKIEHPYLSINPKDPKNKPTAKADEKNELKRTLFHEQLHNLGIRHSEDIEYPYTCETCCMPSKDTEKTEIEAACRICRGGYKDNNDPAYIRDLITWGKASYSDLRVTKSVIKFMKENTGNRQGAFFLAESTASIFNPVGAVIAGKIRAKLKPLSATEEANLKRAEEYKNDELLNSPSIKKLAEITGSSMFAHYVEKDTKKMLVTLEENKREIKNLLAKEKTANANDKYVYENLRKQFKEMLVDVWIYTYTKEKRPETDRAYKLLKDVGLM